jgi:CRISPR system Cascade subunit CasC
VLLVARDSQPINLVGAFEQAVPADEPGGRIATSINRLVRQATDLHEAFDETPLAAWAVGVGERTTPLAGLGERASFDTAVAAVGALVAERLAGRP